MKRNPLFIFVVVIITLYVSAASTFALKNQFNLQARIYASVPIVEIGVPIGKVDYLEFGYGRFDYNGVNYYIPLIYSWQLSGSASERSALRFGAMFYHHDEVDVFFPNHDGTFPVLLYEQERAINDNLTWLFNLGIPNLAGFGLKWYLN
ncbi:MAG: hypothetical protein JW873_06775 [Candidatus Saganbacteria bacterium]|nr:hypothetical protein [Candidatus Saganbacteria bacterium]